MTLYEQIYALMDKRGDALHAGNKPEADRLAGEISIIAKKIAEVTK